jgi:hypothetical protein
VRQFLRQNFNVIAGMIYYWYLKAAEILSPLYNDGRARALSHVI